MKIYIFKRFSHLSLYFSFLMKNDRNYLVENIFFGEKTHTKIKTKMKSEDILWKHGIKWSGREYT